MDKTELNIEKGRRLKECILENYKSSREFVQLVNDKGLYSLTPGNLSQMQKGERSITRDFAHIVAPLLEVSENYLMCETDLKCLLPFAFSDCENNDFSLHLRSVVRVLEIKSNLPVYFYVIPLYISPKKKLLHDLIEKHRKRFVRVPLVDDIFILQNLLDDVSLLPTDRKELSECIKKYIGADKRKRALMTYNDYGSIRKKCTLNDLSNLKQYATDCTCKIDNIKRESFIECVSVNNKLLSYGDFISLVELSSNMILSVFNNSDCLNTVRQIPPIF